MKIKITKSALNLLVDEESCRFAMSKLQLKKMTYMDFVDMVTKEKKYI